MAFSSLVENWRININAPIESRQEPREMADIMDVWGKCTERANCISLRADASYLYRDT